MEIIFLLRLVFTQILLLSLNLYGTCSSQTVPKTTRTMSTLLVYNVCGQRQVYVSTGILQKPVKSRPRTFVPIPCGWFKVENHEIVFNRCVRNTYSEKTSRQKAAKIDRLASIKSGRQMTGTAVGKIRIIPEIESGVTTTVKTTPTTTTTATTTIKRQNTTAARYSVGKETSNDYKSPTPKVNVVSEGALTSNRTIFYFTSTPPPSSPPTILPSTSPPMSSPNSDEKKLTVTDSHSTSRMTEKVEYVTMSTSLQTLTDRQGKETLATDSPSENEINVDSELKPHFEILTQDPSKGVSTKPYFLLYVLTAVILCYV